MKPGMVAAAPPARQTPCSGPTDQLDACDPDLRGPVRGPSPQAPVGQL